jgi:hypothetical protein
MINPDSSYGWRENGEHVSEGKIELEKFTDKMRIFHLMSFLRSELIASASISGLGDKRKARLRQHGISSAADITKQNWSKIRAIKGCSELIDPLMTWRKKVEARFQFDPKSAVKPADFAAIKNGLSVKKLQLEQQISSSLQKLEVTRQDIVRQQSYPPSEAAMIWQQKRQWEFDTKQLDSSLPQVRTKTVLLCAGLVVLAIIGNVSNGARTKVEQPVVSSTAPTSPARVASQSSTSPPPLVQPPSPQAPTWVPVTWDKIEKQGGRFELQVKDPNHSFVHSLAFSCSEAGNFEVKAQLKNNFYPQAIMVDRGVLSRWYPSNPVMTFSDRPFNAELALAVYSVIAGLNPSLPYRTEEIYITTLPVREGNVLGFRVSWNPELRSLKEGCRAGLPPPSAVPGPVPDTKSAPPLEPLVVIRPVPGDPTTASGPPMDITPPGQVKGAGSPTPSRQTPARSPATRSPTGLSGTGGLY